MSSAPLRLVAAESFSDPRVLTIAHRPCNLDSDFDPTRSFDKFFVYLNASSLFDSRIAA